ncbi:MAG TPA: DUF302 domain-containing protein [Caulobacteraceae bacterium]|jgi:uncharacterized protein (DUF302 family)
MTNGLVSRRSIHDAAETARRFRAAAEGAGLTIFAEVDHGRNAAEVGLELRPCILMLFGNPRAGTLLMQVNLEAGVDLPFKAMAWTDENGDTWFGWNDPEWVAERHGLGPTAQATVAAIAAGMDKLGAAATL